MNIKSYKITPLLGGGYEFIQEFIKPQIDDEGDEIHSVSFSCKTLDEVVSALLPDGLIHKDFERIESVYMQERFSDGSWLSVKDYMRLNNIKSRNSVYLKIRCGELQTDKIGKYTYVKDAG